MINSYKYYLNKYRNILYRNNRDNKVNKVMSINQNTECEGYIWGFNVCENYVIAQCSGGDIVKISAYDAILEYIYSVRIDVKEKSILSL